MQPFNEIWISNMNTFFSFCYWMLTHLVHISIIPVVGCMCMCKFRQLWELIFPCVGILSICQCNINTRLVYFCVFFYVNDLFAYARCITQGIPWTHSRDLYPILHVQSHKLIQGKPNMMMKKWISAQQMTEICGNKKKTGLSNQA